MPRWSAFSSKGIDATTIEQIRETSGASHGSIYHYFGSKEAIALALYVEGMHEYQQCVFDRLGKETAAEPGLRALITAHLEWTMGHPGRALYLTRVGMAEVSDEAATQIAEVNQEFFRAIHAWLRPYVERGEVITAPAALYVPLILGPTAHFARHWLAHRLALDIDDVIGTLARAAWQSIRKEI
jgi:AcrR family transcriptional regulator